MLDTEPFIVVRARMIRRGDGSPPPVYLVVDLQGGVQQLPAALEQQVREEQATVYVLEPRGVGPGRWTTKSPPNYVARSHVLLGRTFETGQLWDVIATARMLQARHTGSGKVNVVGQQAAGVLAAYAALLEPEIRAVVVDPLESHRDPAAPCFLNVLRVCDIPEVLGMLDPGALTLVRGTPALRERVQRLQAAVARQ
jgi:hypothetical protein